MANPPNPPTGTSGRTRSPPVTDGKPGDPRNDHSKKRRGVKRTQTAKGKLSVFLPPRAGKSEAWVEDSLSIITPQALPVPVSRDRLRHGEFTPNARNAEAVPVRQTTPARPRNDPLDRAVTEGRSADRSGRLGSAQPAGLRCSGTSHAVTAASANPRAACTSRSRSRGLKGLRMIFMIPNCSRTT